MTYCELDEQQTWKKLRVVTRDYFDQLGIDIDHIASCVLDKVEAASIKAIQDYKKMNGAPPLLINNDKLPLNYVDIPKAHALQSHGYCEGCPKYIREINPCFLGCQLNCQYCLVVSNESIQTEVKMFKNYPEWFGKQLKNNRIKTPDQTGMLYYLSPKTDSLSPEMVETGIAQSILRHFVHHVESETKRMGRCVDTMLIISKAGVQDLHIKGPDGNTVLDLMKEIPDNIQVCGSLNYLKCNQHKSQAI
jgi:hypothetical protein